ncbi:MAG TPA: phage holin family protein [Bryobacteraceae bacterium]|nr:phage holin family protein [Bryobacteraceae bacterium]
MSHRDIHVEPESPNSRPIGKLIANVITDLKAIVRDEARLALVELKDKAGKSRKGAILIAGALLLGFLAVESFLAFCIAVLAIVLPVWLSALLVSVLMAIVVGGIFALGIQALKEVDLLPQKTLEAVKDTLDWARERLS